MATTQNTFNGNGSNLGPFSFTFKWLESTDIKVTVGGVLKTAGTHYNLQGLNYTTKTGGQVLFTAGNAPPVGTNNIRIYRDTDDEVLSAAFSSGSAIRAKDLNDNFTQNLYVTQEINNNALNVDGSNAMVGNLDINNFKVINSSAPLNGTDLANKTYVDDRVSTSAVAGSPYFLQDGAGAVNRSWSSKLKDVVSVKDFGAVGDGVTDDLAKVKAALESGKIVDGAGLSYAINGTLKPTSFKGLQNATLIQISNNTTTNCDTLFLEGLSGFVIRDVTINMGSNITTLFADDGNNGIKIWGTTSGSGTSQTATYVENFTLSNVTVTGNGCGTGIHIRRAKRFSVIDCTVRDRISGSSPDPTNDSQNGFQFNDCANFEVAGCMAYNLLTRLSGVNTNKWTRGFLFAEIRDCTITGCNSVTNDQGYDFSGAVSNTSPSYYQGNRRFTVSGCSAASNGTFGFKCANVTHDALFSGCIVSNVGNTGFVVSSQSTGIALSENSYRTQNLTYTGCKVVNSLNNGWSGYTSAGFYVDADASSLYPRNVKFVGCSVEDNQAVKTTVYGFVTNVPPINPGGTDSNKDITISAKNCSTHGVATPYGGIHFPACYLIGADAGSASNTTWTDVAWNGTEVQDSSGLHSTISNVENIIIKESGLYLVSASVVFNTAAAGQRKIRVLRNGGATGIESLVSAHPTNQTTVSVTGVHYFSTGDTVRIEVWQDSGGSVSYQRNLSSFTVARIV